MTLDQQLEELFNRLSPQVADQFRAAVADVTDNVILQQVIDAIERNDIEGAFRALNFSPTSFNNFINMLQQAFQQAGSTVMATFPKRVAGTDGIKKMLRFDIRDPRAEKWLRDQSSALVVEIEQDTRTAVRNTLEQGLADGRNPRKIALDIVGRINPQTGKREGGVVGLGTREEAWARNARTRLVNKDEGYFNMALRDKRFDATVRSAFASGKPLPGDVVDKLVDRYKVKALQHRGEMIGRTETLAALNKSEWMATKQAVETGDLSSAAVKREWDSAGDARVRPAHRVMDGQTVGLDEAFIAPNGDRLMHPGDTSLGASGKNTILCRCRVRTVVDWDYGVE